MRSLRRGFTSAFGCILLACTPDPAAPTEVGAAEKVPVRITNVAPELRDRISEIGSLLGSCGRDCSEIEVSESPYGSIVLAYDRQGAPLLAAIAMGAGVELNFQSTASALVRSLLLPPALPVVNSQHLTTAIDTHPGLPSLVSLVEKELLAGGSLLSSDILLEEAAGIAASVDLRMPSQRSGLWSGEPVHFPVLPVKAHDAEDSNISLTNVSYIAWEATVEHEPSLELLDRMLLTPTTCRRFAPLGSCVEIGGGNVAGGEGAVRLSLRQTRETRRLHLKQLTVDLLALNVVLLGIDDEDKLASYLSDVLPKVFPTSFVEQQLDKTPGDALAACLAQLSTPAAVTAIAEAALGILLDEGVGKVEDSSRLLALIRKVAKLVMRLSNAITVGAYAGQAFPTYSDWWQLHDKQDDLTLCQQQGSFVRCIEQLEVEPVSLIIGVGQSAPLTTRMTASEATAHQPSSKLEWSSSAPEVAMVRLQGETMYIEGITAGEATVTIGIVAQGQQATVDVRVNRCDEELGCCDEETCPEGLCLQCGNRPALCVDAGTKCCGELIIASDATCCEAAPTKVWDWDLKQAVDFDQAACPAGSDCLDCMGVWNCVLPGSSSCCGERAMEADSECCGRVRNTDLSTEEFWGSCLAGTSCQSCDAEGCENLCGSGETTCLPSGASCCSTGMCSTGTSCSLCGESYLCLEAGDSCCGDSACPAGTYCTDCGSGQLCMGDGYTCCGSGAMPIGAACCGEAGYCTAGSSCSTCDGVPCCI